MAAQGRGLTTSSANKPSTVGGVDEIKLEHGDDWQFHIGLEEDIFAELDHFIFLVRLGMPNADSYFESVLQPHVNIFAVFAEYVDIADQKGFQQMRSLLKTVVSDTWTREEKELLTILTVLDGHQALHLVEHLTSGITGRPRLREPEPETQQHGASLYPVFEAFLKQWPMIGNSDSATMQIFDLLILHNKFGLVFQNSLEIAQRPFLLEFYFAQLLEQGQHWQALCLLNLLSDSQRITKYNELLRYLNAAEKDTGIKLTFVTAVNQQSCSYTTADQWTEESLANSRQAGMYLQSLLGGRCEGRQFERWTTACNNLNHLLSGRIEVQRHNLRLSLVTEHSDAMSWKGYEDFHDIAASILESGTAAGRLQAQDDKLSIAMSVPDSGYESISSPPGGVRQSTSKLLTPRLRDDSTLYLDDDEIQDLASLFRSSWARSGHEATLVFPTNGQQRRSFVVHLDTGASINSVNQSLLDRVPEAHIPIFATNLSREADRKRLNVRDIGGEIPTVGLVKLTYVLTKLPDIPITAVFAVFSERNLMPEMIMGQQFISNVFERKITVGKARSKPFVTGLD